MSDHEDTDGVRQGYVLGLSASEGMDYLVSRPMFDRWLESVKDEAFDDGFYAGSELGYTPERKGDTMSEGDFDCCKPTINSELVVGQEAYKRGYLDGYLAGVKEEKQRIITMTMEETK